MRTHVASVLSWVTSRFGAVCSRRRLALLVLAGMVVAALVGPRLLERQRLPLSTTDHPAQNFGDERREALRSPSGDRGIVDSVAQPPGSPPESSLGAWGRRIARRATLDLELADVDQGVARLTALVESLGGFVGSTDSRTDTKGTTRATVSAYVPPEQFVRALGGLDGIGRVTQRSIGGQDVSEEFVDLEARIRNLERHETQLLSFMNRAQKVQDLLSLESELARVRGEIERATGRVRFLKARTDLATIQVALIRAPLVAPPDGLLARVVEQVRAAFSDGWSTAFGVALSLCLLAAQLSPLAIPVVAGWLIYRYRVGHRKSSV